MLRAETYGETKEYLHDAIPYYNPENFFRVNVWDWSKFL